MRSKLYLAITLAITSAASLLADPPRFSGDTLPVPPQQSAPWKPPGDAGLERWVDAAQTLFTQGFADPRGCEYREIEVTAGSTRGWVLPRAAKWKQDFAVCWNGLVYPVWKVGPPADFRADARGFEKGGDRFSFGATDQLGAVCGHMQKIPGARDGRTWNWLPLKICLLLRLGESGLAREVAELQLSAQREPSVPKQSDDPYLDWARQWCWTLWDRALSAHISADDDFALVSLRQLQRIAGDVSAEATRRGFARYPYGDSSRQHLLKPYLDWISEPLAPLLADQERRAKLPKHAQVFARDKEVPKSTTIAELIDDLQEVAVHQMGQPGGLEPYTSDPIVAAIVDRGEAAVAPLLDAWEKEGERLTRSVSYHRDFFPERYLHPVSQPIAAALAAIMQVSIEDFDALAGGRTPAAVRAYWQKTRGTSPAERWYQTMADDHAGAKAWRLAAEEIVSPANIRKLGNGWSTSTPLKPGEIAALSGESLRAKKKPTLTALWVARAAQIRPNDEQTRLDIFALQYSCKFVANLARWEPAAAVKEAALHMELIRRHFGNHWGLLAAPGQTLLDFQARFAILRADHGDAAGLEDYCAWLASSSNASDHEVFHPNHWRGRESRDRMRMFEPLWRNAKNPTVKAAVFVIFAGPNPPTGPLLQTHIDPAGPLSEIVKTPMLRFAEVRDYALAALNDPAEMGGENPKTRVCDFYATQLAKWKGMPAMELTWPQEQRDAALIECVRVMKDPGAFFDENSPPKQPGGWPSEDEVN